MASITPRLLFHNKGEFRKSLNSLRKSGGKYQQAAERVCQIIGDFSVNGNTFAGLTKEGESRISHCVKYNLTGRCRLVTVQSDNTIWLLYVGKHEDVDHWLDVHKGQKFAAGSNRQIQQPIVSEPGTIEPRSPDIEISSDDRPLLQRIPFPELEELVPQTLIRRQLLEITEETDDDKIVEVVECIQDATIQSLIIDVLDHVRKGQIDDAKTRIDIHFNRAVDVVKETAKLEELLASGDNSELVTDLASLSEADRERLLSDDFEPWMLWLHPDQKRAVEEDFDLPAVLRGVSGSGKTVILIHRARRLANLYPEENIGVLTLNRSLARLLQNLINKLCSEGEAERIKVDAFYDYFSAILSHVGSEAYLREYLRDLPDGHEMTVALSNALGMHQNLAHDFSPQSGETIDDTWSEFWQIDEDDFIKTKEAVIEAIKGRSDYDVKAYLRDEFVLIRSAMARADRVHRGTGKSYFEYSRAGRSIGIQERARQNILRMLRRYEEYMLAGAMMDELALSQAILPTRKALTDLPENLRRRCLLIDEFQDFSTLELSLLKQIPTETENGFFLAGDTVQKVLVKDFNLPEALLDRNYVRTRTITKNYRNSRQILQAAHALISHYGEIAAKHDQAIEVLNPELAVRETAPPIAINSADPIDLAWKTASEWIEGGNREAWSVCIASANPSRLPPAVILERRPKGIKADKLTGDYLLNRDQMVVGTLAEVKGFEFSLIVVVGCDEGRLPDPSIPADEQWRDALRLYVAMTRGRDQVVLLYREKPSPFLVQMNEYLNWQEDAFEYPGERAGKPIGEGAPSPGRDAPVSQPKPLIKIPGKPWPDSLSVAARLCLLRYFEGRIFVPKKHGKNGNSPKHMRLVFDRWLTPANADGIPVSRLFGDGTIRRDLVDEIDRELKRHGFGLIRDK